MLQITQRRGKKYLNNVDVSASFPKGQVHFFSHLLVMFLILWEKYKKDTKFCDRRKGISVCFKDFYDVKIAQVLIFL